MKVLLEKIFQKIKKTPGDIVGYEDLYYMCLEALNEDKELAVE